MDILVANLVAGIVLFVFARWRKDIFFAVAGIWLTVAFSVFACYAGRLHILETAACVVGVVLIGADMSGRLPGRSRLIRDKQKTSE